MTGQWQTASRAIPLYHWIEKSRRVIDFKISILHADIFLKQDTVIPTLQEELEQEKMQVSSALYGRKLIIPIIIEL